MKVDNCQKSLYIHIKRQHMNKFPTVLWIPGLGHRPDHFTRIIDHLTKSSWQSECVNLPSSNVEAKERTFLSDAKETKSHLDDTDMMIFDSSTLRTADCLHKTECMLFR